MSEERTTPQLTQNQQKAYELGHGQAIITAGAGSGKTRVLVERFVRLVQERKARVDEILMVTFTEKAAREMRERILKSFKQDSMKEFRENFQSGSVCTIHSFCAQIIRENQMLIPHSAQFRLLDRATHLGLLEEALLQIIDQHYLNQNSQAISLVESFGFKPFLSGCDHIFGKLKSLGLSAENLFYTSPSPEELAALEKQLVVLEMEAFKLTPETDWETLIEWQNHSFPAAQRDQKRMMQNLLETAFELKSYPLKKEFIELLKSVWEEYEKLKFEYDYLDYDDLQIIARDLLVENPKILKKYQQRFKFIMVDEYQDTNPLQVQIIQLLSQGKTDVVVGDKKQAIYGFRHADVTAFIERESEAALQGNGNSIILGDNFRSAPAIIDFVNLFFKRVWHGDEKMAYQPLSIGLKDDENKKGRVDIALVDSGQDDGLNMLEARRCEASWMADQITELVKTQGYSYQDIVILIRSTTVLPVYEKIFRQKSIPLCLVSGRGFYSQQEIYDCINFLKVLHNRELDIPLAGFLRSPFVGITDETLYWLGRYSKKESREPPLWKSILEIDKISHVPDEEKEKIRTFLQKIEHLQKQSSLWSFSKLMDEGIRVFRYATKSLFFIDGKKRLANIQKLISFIHQFEQNRPHSNLEELVQYLDRLEKDESKEEEAFIEETAEEAVHVMTMHKSKGLEFPVVFAADLGRADVRQKGDFRVSAKGEITFKILNPLTNQKEKPSRFNKMRKETQKEEWDEKKRLFYVVATRARERLFLVGTSNLTKPKKEIQDWMKRPWADWLVNLFGLESEEVDLPEGTHFTSIPALPVNDEKQRENLTEKKALDFYAGENNLKSLDCKTSLSQESNLVTVTELVHLDQCPYRYYLIDDLGVSWNTNREEKGDLSIQGKGASEFGTLAHRILELVDFSRFEEHSLELIEQQYSYLSKEIKSKLYQVVCQLKKSTVLEKVLNSTSVYKEWPFMLKHNGFILEGTIDLLLELDSKNLFLVDYKTSVLNKEKAQQHSEHYRFQLELYLWVVSHFYPPETSIKGGVLYLRNGEFVPIDLPKREVFEAKLSGLLSKLFTRDFTLKPSPTQCETCPVSKICVRDD